MSTFHDPPFAPADRFRAAFDQSPDALLIVTPEAGRIVAANLAFEESSGWTAAALGARRLGDLLTQESRAHREAVIEGALAGLKTARVDDVVLVRPDGGSIATELEIAPIHASDGVFALVAIRDSTREQRLQERMLQTEKLSSLGQLVSGFAHEVNNPLTGILGYAQMVLERGATLPADLRSDVERIFEGAQRTQQIISNLLKFARAEPQSELPYQPNALLEECLTLKDYALRVSDVAVRRELDPALPTLSGSPHRLRQAFLNVIENAHDAMAATRGGGTLVVRTRLRKDRVEIEFLDDGPGIAEPRRVFDPFYTTKGVGKGTGLGLSVSYGVIRDHGGEITAENRPEGGARVVVWLPVTGATTARAMLAPTTRVVATRGNGERVLVVDDEDIILAVTEKVLRDANYKVTVARSGHQAVLKLRDDTFDLVLTDIRMPRPVDGIDLYYWIRSNRSGLESRVMFMTGDTLREETRTFLESVPNVRLAKPFSPEELRRTVRHALDSNPVPGMRP